MNYRLLVGILFILLLVLPVTVSADFLNTSSVYHATLYIQTANSTWATLHDTATGSILTTGSNPSIQSASFSGNFNQIYRNGHTWNTTTLPDNAIIDNVSLYMKTYVLTADITNDLGGQFQVVSFTPAGTTRAYGTSSYNYSLWGTTAFYSRAITGIQNSTYYQFYLSSDSYPYINTTGDTVYGFRMNNDTANIPPAWIIAKTDKVAWSRTNSENYLNISYHLPDITPPASITDLSNLTATCQQLSFNWTNPTDADFNHTYILKDNVFYTNASNSTTSVTWTELTGEQSYTFSSKTVDITGNMNATWVNMTATPVSCSAAPTTSFTLSKPILRIPMTLTATDTSTNTPTAWNWSWGDGTWTNGTTQNATHKYTKRGRFSVNLLSSNAGGSNITPTASTVRIVGYENSW
jgi:PKD repeat protein